MIGGTGIEVATHVGTGIFPKCGYVNG